MLECEYFVQVGAYGNKKYAIEAINKHGPFKGFWLAIKRISKCHPWGDSVHDPVP